MAFNKVHSNFKFVLDLIDSSIISYKRENKV